MKRPAHQKSRSQKPPAGPAGPRTDWGDVADWYDNLVGATGSEYHREVILPGALRLIAPQPSEPIIDIACGQGVLCRALQSRGVEATGVDAAEGLIFAAKKHGPDSIHYHTADVRELGFLPSSHFAAAACVMAIQNINPIAPVFAEVSRILKPSGRFVIVMLHPSFRGAKETSWAWDEKEKVQYRRVDRYLLPRKSPIVTHPGSAPDEYTWEFHRPLEAYFKAVRQAGMTVDALEEWPSHKNSDSGPRAAAENTARKEIPMFLALRAIKPFIAAQ